MILSFSLVTTQRERTLNTKIVVYSANLLLNFGLGLTLVTFDPDW